MDAFGGIYPVDFMFLAGKIRHIRRKFKKIFNHGIKYIGICKNNATMAARFIDNLT